jgi:PilZ domain
MVVRQTPISRVAERRTALRYPLKLPVVFSWQDDTGRVHGCDGYCRDLGSRGIYVSAQLVPPLGASVEMNVFLPRPGHSTRPSEIHAIGRVVRSEQQTVASEIPGFAAMNHTTRLREARTGQVEAEDYAVDDLGIGGAEEGNETLSEE